jgi:hypothetical protein
MILIINMVHEKDNLGRISENLSGQAESEDSAQMAETQGSAFQVDVTPVDVCLVSTRNRNPIIGRPIIYFIPDETGEPKRALESA